VVRLDHAVEPDNARRLPGRWLLSTGLIAGPLFVLAFLLEGAFRTGYSPVRDMVSALDLSGDGWQQIASFLVTGCLLLVFAAGVRKVVPAGPASRWGPILVALTGIGLMISGVFMPDATRGYPPGTPPGPQTGSSWHNTAHGLGALLWILSVTHARLRASPRPRQYLGPLAPLSPA
jgi:Protein of unknown function (DUF998)